MNNLLKDCKIRTFKVIFQYQKSNCLFPIDAYMVWCPTWSKNLGRYLLDNISKRLRTYTIFTQIRLDWLCYLAGNFLTPLTCIPVVSNSDWNQRPKKVKPAPPQDHTSVFTVFLGFSVSNSAIKKQSRGFFNPIIIVNYDQKMQLYLYSF